MNDARRRYDELTLTLGSEHVSYALRVLSSTPREPGVEVRRVLFSRTSKSASIEIRAETDAPNVLSKLPELIDAAIDLQRALWPASCLGDESRRMRRLSEGALTSAGELRLLEMACRARDPEALAAPSEARAAG